MPPSMPENMINPEEDRQLRLSRALQENEKLFADESRDDGQFRVGSESVRRGSPRKDLEHTDDRKKRYEKVLEENRR